MIILVVIFLFMSIWCPISYYSIRHLWKEYNNIKLKHGETVKWTSQLENTVNAIDARKLEKYCDCDDRDVSLFIEQLKVMQTRIQNSRLTGLDPRSQDIYGE